MSPPAALRPEDIRALEQTRQRLSQLSNNIGSLKADIHRNNPLPEWSVESSDLLYPPFGDLWDMLVLY